MNKVIIAIMFCLIFLSSLYPQTVIYVSSSQGDDSSSGTSEVSPWKSISKLNSFPLSPGDKVYFKRGDTWKDTIGLVIKYSGTENNRIIYSGYGTGNKPVITLKKAINATWTQYNSNVWYTSTPNHGIPIERMWFNGIEKEQARSVWNGNNFDGTFGVCAEHPFYHDNSGQKLFVYANSNPNGYYSSIEYQGGLLEFTPQYHTVQLIDADYVTIDGLDLQGGGYSAIGLAGSDYAEIKNCNIGNASSRAGIFANSSQISYLAVDQTSDFGKIYNCTVNSHWNYTLKFYTALTPYGILIGWGASNWEIHNNYIKDWWFGVYTGTGEVSYQKSFYHNIYNNEIEAPNFSYGKGIQITSWNLPSTGFYTWCNVYNNYIHNIRAAGMSISSSGNKVFFNIIDSIDISRCTEKGDQANSGMGIELSIDQSWGIGGSLDSNFIFNNTFYRLNKAAMNWYNPYVYNNLYLQTGMSTQFALAVSQSGFRYRNNLFFKSGSDASTKFIWNNSSSSSYSVTEFNGLGGNVSGNIYPVGKTLSQIMNDNFTLPLGSPALNAGIDISSLVPAGITDRLGNLVDRSNPSIGATQNSFISDVTPPRLISASLMDSAKLFLSFSEPLGLSGILTLSNYFISNGISIQAAQLGSNQSDITLFTSAHTFGQNYTIIVNNLKDLAGNIIQSSSNSANYYCSFNPPPTGGLSKLLIIEATASDTDDVNYGPDKTIDGLYFSNGGNLFSRWAAIPTPQWLIYDLGTIKQVSKTRISFYEFENGRTYTYNVYVSNDKVTWTNVISNAISSSQEWTEKSFNSIFAKYVKIEIVSNNQNTWATVWEAEVWGNSSVQSTKVNSKIFLQGPYANGQMTTILRDLSQIPLVQPYNNAPWNYNGNENVSTLPPGIVDWLLIELRIDTSVSSILARRAAFVKSDGRLVDLDGESQVNFSGISNGNYYLVLHHRNHLSIMSAAKITLSESSALYDYTLSPSSAYGNDLADFGGGTYGMYAGDGDANQTVNVLDYSSVGNNLFQVGYKQGDQDLNNIINILDYGKTNQNLFKFSRVPGVVISQ